MKIQRHRLCWWLVCMCSALAGVRPCVGVSLHCFHTGLQRFIRRVASWQFKVPDKLYLAFWRNLAVKNCKKFSSALWHLYLHYSFNLALHFEGLLSEWILGTSWTRSVLCCIVAWLSVRVLMSVCLRCSLCYICCTLAFISFLISLYYCISALVVCCGAPVLRMRGAVSRGRPNFLFFFVFGAEKRIFFYFLAEKDAHIFGVFYFSVQIWP